MSKCPICAKEVFFAERVTALGSDWHKSCFRCTNAVCNTVLVLGKQNDRDGKPYCANCYSSLFGPKGYRQGAMESHEFHAGDYGYKK